LLPCPPSVTPLATFPFSHVLSPGQCKNKIYPLYYTETDETFSQYPFLTDSSGFLGKLALPRLTRFVLSRLYCHGHSLLLSSYLCRIKRMVNSSCNACGHHLQNLTHPSGLSRIRAFRCAIFGTTSSILDL